MSVSETLRKSKVLILQFLTVVAIAAIGWLWFLQPQTSQAQYSVPEREEQITLLQSRISEIERLISKGKIATARKKAWDLLDDHWIINKDLLDGFRFEPPIPLEAVLDVDVWEKLQRDTGLDIDHILDALRSRRDTSRAYADAKIPSIGPKLTRVNW